MIPLMVLWFVLAGYDNGYLRVLPTLLTALVTAVVLDVVLGKLIKKQWKLPLPKSAIITGLLVGGILSPETPLWLMAVAAAVAIGSKYVIRLPKEGHIFNPANFGILIAAALLGGQAVWWIGSNTLFGALAGLLVVVPIVILGLLNSFNVQRLYASIAFLIVEFVALVALGIPFTPALSLLNVFIAFFMVVEPNTSPYQNKNMAVYGAIAGLLAAVFLQVGATQLFADNLALAAANLSVPLLARVWKD